MELNKVLEIVAEKVERSVDKVEGFPHITESGKWITTKDGYWTGGFWVGLLWYAYKITNNEKYKKEAYKWAKRLENRKSDKTFDLSFLFYPSFVLGYEITGNMYFRMVAMEAAETLSTLFHEKAGFVYNEIDGKTGRTIIDVMMDLQLLWWAYKETGDMRFHRVATTHSKRTIDELVRDDYSTIHILDYDLESGEPIRKVTAQGYSDDSCWSRGHAWAVYGFALAYKYTKDELFLKTAVNIAEYFIANLPEDYVPYWDFDDLEKEVRDSSVAAIAASGLITLSELREKKGFKEAAINILNSLCDNYLSREGEEGILKHGCFHKPAGMGVDESLIWGDYYFIEAIMKYNGLER